MKKKQEPQTLYVVVQIDDDEEYIISYSDTDLTKAREYAEEEQKYADKNGSEEKYEVWYVTKREKYDIPTTTQKVWQEVTE